MIEKYDRFAATIVGGNSGKAQSKALKIENRLCTFMGMKTATMLILGHLTMTLAYLSMDCEAAMLAYMTRSFIEMKKKERS